MDPTKENIPAIKNGQEKMFSQRQLDMMGPSADGSFDGWIVQGKKPVGIPDKVVLPLGSDDPKTDVVNGDPNGGLVVHQIATGLDPDPAVLLANALVVPDGVVQPAAVSDPVVTGTPAERVNKPAANTPKKPA